MREWQLPAIMAAQWIHRGAGTATLFRVIAPATSSGQLGKAARPSRGESRDVTAVWNTGGAIPQTPRHATASNTGQGGRMGLEESDSTEKEAVGNRSLHVNREQAASKKNKIQLRDVGRAECVFVANR